MFHFNLKKKKKTRNITSFPVFDFYYYFKLPKSGILKRPDEKYSHSSYSSPPKWSVSEVHKQTDGTKP